MFFKSNCAIILPTHVQFISEPWKCVGNGKQMPVMHGSLSVMPRHGISFAHVAVFLSDGVTHVDVLWDHCALQVSGSSLLLGVCGKTSWVSVRNATRMRRQRSPRKVKRRLQHTTSLSEGPALTGNLILLAKTWMPNQSACIHIYVHIRYIHIYIYGHVYFVSVIRLLLPGSPQKLIMLQRYWQ